MLSKYSIKMVIYLFSFVSYIFWCVSHGFEISGTDLWNGIYLKRSYKKINICSFNFI